MPFLNAIVRRPERGWWGVNTKRAVMTRQEAAEVYELGSLKWQIVTTQTELVTVTAFAAAAGVAPTLLIQEVGRVKARTGLDIKFLPDVNEVFDHDEYREGV